MNVHVPQFKFTDKQQEANYLLAGNQRSTLLVGGARSGKTFLIVRAIIVRALRAPLSRHAIFRFRYNAVRASVWLDTFPKVMQICFPGVGWKDNRQDSYVQLPNGSQIYFCGLDEKERVEKILGMEFATLFFNEASQIPYSSYTVARTRLAQVVYDSFNDKPLKQREYIDLNPVGISHWTYQQFIKKCNPISKQLFDDPDNYASIFINPYDNIDNLDPESIHALESLPERQKKRFLAGEYVSDIEGALWPLEVIENCRCSPADVPQLSRVVVAIDPSGTKGEDDVRSDLVGIAVVGKGINSHGYLLADRSCNLGPLGWGRRAVEAYKEFKCDKIIAERNFGGAMVETVIRTTDPSVAYKEVVASRGKVIRAEPIAALYEKKLIHHVGRFPDLEEEMCGFSTNGFYGEHSPDRADALVHGFSELFLEDTFDLGLYIQAHS